MAANWRDKKTWNVAGYALTAAWIGYVALKSGGDPAHPLFDFIFLVPIALWLVIIVATRLLGAGRPPPGPEA
jgi:hypothetical protein